MFLAMAPRITPALRRGLVSAVGATVTAGLVAGYVGHRPGSSAVQPWAGGLSTPAPESEHATPISSASLVVPKAQLALPALPPKPFIMMKTRCDSADSYCVVRPQLRVTPTRQSVWLETPAARPKPKAVTFKTPGLQPPPRAGLIATLNPLGHIPSMTGIGQRFAAAKDAVGGWFR